VLASSTVLIAGAGADVRVHHHATCHTGRSYAGKNNMRATILKQNTISYGNKCWFGRILRGILITKNARFSAFLRLGYW
jgi:hypothetical protein